MTARNRVVREPYATWCGRTPVEIIHGLLPDFLISRESAPSEFVRRHLSCLWREGARRTTSARESR